MCSAPSIPDPPPQPDPLPIAPTPPPPPTAAVALPPPTAASAKDDAKLKAGSKRSQRNKAGKGAEQLRIDLNQTPQTTGGAAPNTGTNTGTGGGKKGGGKKSGVNVPK